MQPSNQLLLFNDTFSIHRLRFFFSFRVSKICTALMTSSVRYNNKLLFYLIDDIIVQQGLEDTTAEIKNDLTQ